MLFKNIYRKYDLLEGSWNFADFSEINARRVNPYLGTFMIL